MVPFGMLMECDNIILRARLQKKTLPWHVALACLEVCVAHLAIWQILLDQTRCSYTRISSHACPGLFAFNHFSISEYSLVNSHWYINALEWFYDFMLCSYDQWRNDANLSINMKYPWQYINYSLQQIRTKYIWEIFILQLSTDVPYVWCDVFKVYNIQMVHHQNQFFENCNFYLTQLIITFRSLNRGTPWSCRRWDK